MSFAEILQNFIKGNNINFNYLYMYTILYKIEVFSSLIRYYYMCRYRRYGVKDNATFNYSSILNIMLFFLLLNRLLLRFIVTTQRDICAYDTTRRRLSGSHDCNINQTQGGKRVGHF